MNLCNKHTNLKTNDIGLDIDVKSEQTAMNTF